MRIATWNVAGRKDPTLVAAQIAELERWQADIYVITEPTAGLEIAGLPKVESPLRSPGGVADRWVAIYGPSAHPVPLACPVSRMATAAEVTIGGQSVVVYGSVLPWGTAHRTEVDAPLPGDTYRTMFQRLLREQAQDVAVLKEYHPASTVIWAGDFNQTLGGSCVLGKTAHGVMLADALDKLDMAAWNRDEPHLKDGAAAIDLICGPSSLQDSCRTESYRPTLEDRDLSDHAGYVVEVDVT